jgi:hypothetical protein
MNFSLNTFLKPLTATDLLIRIFNTNGILYNSINPFSVLRTYVSNNLLNINLNRNQTFTLNFETEDNAKQALFKLQAQIDILKTRPPAIVDTKIQNQINSTSIGVGVNTGVDLNKSPLPTTNDGDSTGLKITYTPFLDSTVTIKVNGVEVNLGDGAKAEACYFSADNGLNAKAIAAIAAGDTLYWNGSHAGYELDSSDDVDISYQRSNLG